MKTHYLKTWPDFFKEVKDSNKPFEVRKDDREFNTGDYLALQEFCPDKGYTGREAIRKVTYILRGGQFGIEKGYCVLGLKIV